jgi:hypothetical protein
VNRVTRRRDSGGRLFAPLLLLVLPLVVAAGCGRGVERIAERRVNALLPEVIGPADRYATRVRGDSPGALSRGRMRRVHVDGVGVRLSETLTVDTLVLDLDQVAVDLKARRLRGVERVTFRASVGEENLNRYLRAQRPDIPGLRVALGPSRATVHARPQLLGISTVPVSVDGAVTPRAGGRFLDFIPNGAQVSIVPVPAPVLRYLSEKVNPVIDLTAVRIPVRVERVEIRSGTLLLGGSVAPEDLLRLAAAP